MRLRPAVPVRRRRHHPWPARALAACVLALGACSISASAASAASAASTEKTLAGVRQLAERVTGEPPGALIVVTFVNEAFQARCAVLCPAATRCQLPPATGGRAARWLAALGRLGSPVYLCSGLCSVLRTRELSAPWTHVAKPEPTVARDHVGESPPTFTTHTTHTSGWLCGGSLRAGPPLELGCLRSARKRHQARLNAQIHADHPPFPQRNATRAACPKTAPSAAPAPPKRIGFHPTGSWSEPSMHPRSIFASGSSSPLSPPTTTGCSAPSRRTWSPLACPRACP